MKLLDSLDYKIRSEFIIKTNPLNFIYGNLPLSAELNATVEYAVNRNISVQLGAAYVTKSPLLLLLGDSATNTNLFEIISYQGYRIQLQGRYYTNLLKGVDVLDEITTDEIPTGLYLGLHASYAYARVGDKNRVNFNEYISAEHRNFNFIMGYQLHFTNQIIIDFGLGLGWKDNTWRLSESNGSMTLIDTQDFGSWYNSNVNLFTNLSIGYAF